jgi:hypothetical protein
MTSVGGIGDSAMAMATANTRRAFVAAHGTVSSVAGAVDGWTHYTARPSMRCWPPRTDAMSRAQATENDLPA